MSDTHAAITIEFPNEMAKRQAQAAIKVFNADMDTYRTISEAMRLRGNEYVGETIDMRDGLFVVEVRHGDGTYHAVVKDGRKDPQGFDHRDEAILRAVELRHGGGPDTQGARYAAKMLGLPSAD